MNSLFLQLKNGVFLGQFENRNDGIFIGYKNAPDSLSRIYG